MPTIITILIASYIVSINFYGILILHFQKKESKSENVQTPPVKDSKLFLTGLLGGAIGIYIFMFVFKYRLKSFFMMIFMPLLVVLNVYFFVTFMNSGIGFFLF